MKDTEFPAYKWARRQEKIPTEVEALRGRVSELMNELNNIKKEAETNQKWAFLEWRQRAEEAEQQVAELTGAIQNLVNVKGRHHTEQAYKQLESLLGKAKTAQFASPLAPPLPVIPDGCVVVPREATDEMLLAAESVKQYELSTPRLRWEAMLAAGEVKP